MSPSTLTVSRWSAPAHVAVIMDGNGRWATRRGRPRTAGHLAGARALRPIVRAAADAGVKALTLYAFSADNWARPAEEVRALMTLFARYMRAEAARCAADGVRLQVIGRRDRLDPTLRGAIAAAELATRAGRALRLRIAVDYSARDAIVAAASGCAAAPASDARAARDRFARAVAAASHDPDPPGDVDLLVRTGGELRLSDFLLWECAYAELWFTDVLWPDFTPGDFGAALAAFAQRRRRFGALPDAEAAPEDAPGRPAAAGRRGCA